MKKIGIDIRELTKGATGIATYSRNLINFLTIHDKKNQYYLLSNGTPSLSGIADNFKVITKKCSNNFIWENFYLNRLLKKHKIDLLINPYYKVPLNINVPVIVTVHDIGFITYPIELYSRSSIYRYFAKINLVRSLKKSLHILVVSNYSKQELIKHFNIPDSKITVLYNTLDNIFKNQSEKDFEKLNIPDKYILYVGNFKPHKNIHSLVKGFSILRNEIPHNLLLVGPEDKWKNILNNFIFSIKLQDRVIFKQINDVKTLKQIYSHAAMLAHPSLFEGFGLPPIEAQSCGCPVISSDSTSLPEILKDSVLYIKPTNPIDISNKILRLLNDNSLRNKLIKKGFKNCKRFDSEKVMQPLLDLIEKY